MKKILLTSTCAMLMLGAGAANATTFNIIVNYLGDGEEVPSDSEQAGMGQTTEAFSDRQIELFGAAENFWESVLTGFTGLVDATYNLDAWMTPEDGFDNSLAYAGPSAFETQSGFDRATAGYMQFDSDDFGAATPFPQTEQLFLDSAVHEIAHALGFGTQFSFNGLVDSSGNNYIGTNALEAYNNTNGTSVTSILLEDGGGHWNECWVEILTDSSCEPLGGSGDFNDSELMTPQAFDDPATFAAATIGAFRDLGYLTIEPTNSIVLPLASEIGSDVAPIPLPAAGWLLLAGVGGLVVAKRKRKS